MLELTTTPIISDFKAILKSESDSISENSETEKYLVSITLGQVTNKEARGEDLKWNSYYHMAKSEINSEKEEIISHSFTLYNSVEHEGDISKDSNPALRS